MDGRGSRKWWAGVIAGVAIGLSLVGCEHLQEEYDADGRLIGVSGPGRAYHHGESPSPANRR